MKTWTEHSLPSSFSLVLCVCVCIEIIIRSRPFHFSLLFFFSFCDNDVTEKSSSSFSLSRSILLLDINRQEIDSIEKKRREEKKKKDEEVNLYLHAPIDVIDEIIKQHIFRFFHRQRPTHFSKHHVYCTYSNSNLVSRGMKSIDNNSMVSSFSSA